MKKTILTIGIIFLFLALIATGCKKEEPLETDPAKIILGKWEFIAMNDEPLEMPIGYVEYLTDSISREFEYETETYFYKKYWIDTLLHKSIVLSDGYMLRFEYKYSFTDKNNKLTLNWLNVDATYTQFTYKRLK